MILLGIFILIGYVLAIKLPLVWQLAIMLLSAWYANSELVRRREIKGIWDLAAILLMLVGMVVGDLIYFFAHNKSTGVQVLVDAFRWFLP